MGIKGPPGGAIRDGVRGGCGLRPDSLEDVELKVLTENAAEMPGDKRSDAGIGKMERG